MTRPFFALFALALTVFGSGPALAQTSTTPEKTRNVAILVYPGVELLDFAGPGEVFKAAGKCNVYTVAETKETVRSMGFVDVVPEYTFASCPDPDIVVIPGGGVPVSNEALKSWVLTCSEKSEIVMSVCNGALVLANAGLLKDLEVTTHHSTLERLALMEPTAKVFTNRRFVDNGNIITTAGISAGIDGSLHLVQRLYGESVARETARYMEYDWRPEEIAKQHAEPGRTVELGVAALIVTDLAHMRAGPALEKHMPALGAVSPEERASAERMINVHAYALMRAGDKDQAHEVLHFQVAAFPDSANPYDSLSEAYELWGEDKKAIEYAEEALKKVEDDKGITEERREQIRVSAMTRVLRLRDGEAPSHWVCPPCNSPCDKKKFEQAGACPGCGMELIVG